jgi:hypothetical protein
MSAKGGTLGTVKSKSERCEASRTRQVWLFESNRCPQIHRPRSRLVGIPKNSHQAGGRDLSTFMWVSPPEWDVELVGNGSRESGVPELTGQQT